MKRIVLACFLVMAMVGQAAAGSVTIASGAGYKKLVTALAKDFETTTGNKVELVFGNMGQVTTQAKTSGAVDVLIGEKGFLERGGITYSGFAEVGRGHLVLAWPKGKTLKSAADIAKPDIKRVAMPDPKKAIYGKAASEFLKNTGLDKSVDSKLLVVGTVPQVTTYLLSGEVDAGFVNRTDVMNVGSSIGGSIEVDPTKYAPITIVAERVADTKNAATAKAFTDFLGTEAAKAIAAKHGM